MNKSLVVTALFTLTGCMALALPAFAQNGAAPPQNPQTAAGTPNQPATSVKHDGKRAVPPTDSRMCIRDTGSHIPPPKGQCLPVTGNSYSHQDIQRTGATNVGQALQMLDPSVQVRGGGY